MKKIISLILLFAFGFAHAETASQMPTKIQMPWAKNAGSSYIRTIPVSSQIGIQNGAASWADGYPPLNFTPIAAGGVPPYGQDTNGALNAISALSWWYSAGGPINYDSAFQTAIGGYPKGAILQSAVTVGLLWVNNVDNNTTNPDASGAGWTSYTPQYATNLTGSGTISSTTTGGGGLSVAMANTLTSTIQPAVVGTTQAIGTSNTQIATTQFVNPGTSIASSGYRKFPDGIIMQWTSSSTTAAGTITVPFPIAFPNGCLQSYVSLGYSGFGTPGPVSSATGSCTTTAVNVGVTGAASFQLFVIGH